MNTNTSLVMRPSTEVAVLGEYDIAEFLREQGQNNYLQVSQNEADHVVSRVPFRKTVEIQKRLIGIDPVTNAESFLKHTYAHINELGASYSIDELSTEEKVPPSLDEQIKANQQSGLLKHSDRLQRDYDKFQGLRRVFREMQAQKLLAVDSILPITDLPETFFAEPVWFIKKTGLQGIREEQNRDANRRYFQEKMPLAFAQAFFVFNPEPLLLKEFSTLSEPVPVPIMKVMAVGDSVFDYIVISTPYHHLAAQVWETPWKFMLSLDPEVFGFIDGLPWFFRMGRWSGDGFLAQKCAQIAVTAKIVREYSQEIRKFLKILYRNHKSSFDNDDRDLFEKGVAPLTNYYSPCTQQIPVREVSLLKKFGRFLSHV